MSPGKGKEKDTTLLLHTDAPVEEEEETQLVKIKDTTNDFLDGLREFKVIDRKSFDNAQIHLEVIRSAKKEISAYWAPLIEAAFNTKKSATEGLRGVRDKEEECLSRSEAAEAKLLRLRLNWKVSQDLKDKIEKEKQEALAEKEAKKTSDRLLKKAEKAKEPAHQERLIEKADDVRVAPVFIPKTVSKSERSASGTLNTFVPVVQVEVHDVKSICGMIFRGELGVDCVKVSEAKIKAWANSFSKPAGMYDGFNITMTEKERITTGKKK